MYVACLQADASAEPGHSKKGFEEAEREQSAVNEDDQLASAPNQRKAKAALIVDDSGHPLRHTDFPRSVWTCLLRLRAEGEGPAAECSACSALNLHLLASLTVCSRRCLGMVEVLEGGAGHEGWVVGGAVRDLLLNNRPKDFDIVTTATPAQVRRWQAWQVFPSVLCSVRKFQ